MNEEFYIGWQAAAPAGIARTIRKAVLILALAVAVIPVLLVSFEKPFSTGVFEFGKYTELEGVLSLRPAPFLQIGPGKQVLLLGPGKTGADSVLSGLGRKFGTTPDGKRVKLGGYLIYHDGKTAMELENDPDGWTLYGTPGAAPVQPTRLGAATLCGELTDPKCFLGVMKPGEGKPHRACSVRCVAGGIPPVLKVTGPGGESEYYLIAGPGGAPANRFVLPYMADAVRITGRLEQQNDWLVLYCNPDSIERIDAWRLNPGPICH